MTIQLLAGNVASAAAIRCREVLTSASPDGLYHLEPKELEGLNREGKGQPRHQGQDTATKVIAAIFAVPGLLKTSIELFFR
ncbi:hypothetical protein N7493_002747 [Penicillium malachiteum]|uniref:Uncharacterized protein n=1 Tax=Penicillium malachiteum TaxID=1324776 RepID=A0AAD6MZ00_9EURO|nr:hypothetical protein N7493_002747 [Penicillium malachiteum]